MEQILLKILPKALRFGIEDLDLVKVGSMWQGMIWVGDACHLHINRQSGLGIVKFWVHWIFKSQLKMDKFQ